AIGVTADAAIVRIRTRLPLAGCQADWLAVEGVATEGAAHQALQEVAGVPLPQAGTLAILVQLRLHGGKELAADQRRHGHTEPRVLRYVGHRDGTARLQRAATLRPRLGLQGSGTRLAKRRLTGIGGV